MYYCGPKLHLLRPHPLYYKLKNHQRDAEVDSNTIREILAEYDLELLGKPRYPPAKGGHSQSFLIHTSDGKKILKKYKHTVIRPTIIYEHSILTYLAQIDFPCPHLVATRGGKTWVCKSEGNHALFDFIENGYNKHNNYILLPGQARQIITSAGKLLAILQDKLKDFTPQGYNPNGFKSQSYDRWRDLDWYMNRLTHCIVETSRLNKTENGSQATWLLEKAKNFDELLCRLDVMLKEAALPRLIIHGDYSPGNLLLRKNAHTIILDFEMARLDWRAAELVDSIWRFGYDRYFGFRINKIKWFLDAYQTYTQLTQSELQLIPALWRYLHIRRSIRHWYYYCSTRDDSRLTKACHFAKMVDWITVNQGELMSALGAKSNC